jgi:hypothetical protein
VFWFGFSVPYAKVVVTRVLLFSVLALDALLQIRHAPRYGAGGFNVAQLPGLDHLGPSRVGFGASELALAACFAFATLGVATRAALAIAAALYAWLYFGSQVDSYQHHYLVVLVLAIASFVPWQRPANATAATPIRSWALRLILVQLALLYLWAAISKLDGAWLDGRTLALQLGSASGTPVERLPAISRIVEHTVGWATAAKLVLVSEVALAATIWHRRSWWLAAPLGVAFHIGIAMTSLEIGLFAYIMIAAYALVIPDRVYLAAAPLVSRVGAPAGAAIARAVSRVPRGWPTAGVALVAALALGFACRLEDAGAIALVVAVVALAIGSRRARRGASPVPPALALLAATTLWFAVDHLSTVTVDYYRLWGGSSRRLGDRDDAVRAYTRLVDLEPDSAESHLHLGRALLDRDDGDDATAGVAELRLARAADPHDARPYVEEARWLARHGHRADALATARVGVAVDPHSKEAHAAIEALVSAGGDPAGPAGGDD